MSTLYLSNISSAAKCVQHLVTVSNSVNKSMCHMNGIVYLNVKMCVHGDVYHDRDLNNRSGCSDVIGCHCALPQIYTRVYKETSKEFI